MNPQWIIFILIGLFIVFRIYKRVRRTFEWQEIKVGRLRFSTIVLSIIGLVFLAEGATHAVSLISDVVGIVLGIALAYYGASTTRFERRDGRHMYRPNPWIGGAVTVLFLSRLGYRVYELTQPGQYEAGAAMAVPLQMTGNLWLSGFLLIMFAYYIVYNILIMRGITRLGSQEGGGGSGAS